MRIEILLKICQAGMFLVQWVIMAVTSLNLLKTKIESKRKTFVFYIILGMGSAAISRVILSVTKSVLLNVVLCAGIVIMVHVLLFADSLKKRIGLGAIEMMISLIGESGTAYLLLTTAHSRGIDMLYGYDSMYAHTEYVVLSSIYSTLIFFVLFMILLVLWKGIVDRFWMKAYLLYIIVPFYQLILILIYYATCKNLEEIELTIGVILVVFSLIIDFSLIYLVGGMLKKEQVEKELTALYAQRQTEQQYYEMAVNNMTELKEIKQNYTGQLQNIYDLLENGENNSEIKDLLDRSSQKLQATALKRYCENAIVNAILTIKSAAALEKGIDVDCACGVPESVGIEAIDLCSLFANLLDNAIEACEKSEDTMQKAISIHAGVRGGYLTIKTENTYSQPVVREKGKFLTSKSDSANHGYGLKLIDDIIRKYDGNLKIDAEAGIFKVVASLKV
ncbi:MAG: sensor histidine kinase [Lachnospiraceae bacterium]|nr:sensor histidine kinase [Lachnospiraceae bacterium]